MTQAGVHLPAVHVHFSRPMLILLAILLTGPWLIVALLVGRAWFHHPLPGPAGEVSQPTSEQVVEGKPGPWGFLEYVPMTIGPPDEFVFVPPADYPPIRWHFQGYSKDKVIELFHSAELTPAQIDALLKRTWSTDAGGTAVEPGDDVIMGLSPAARAKIYSVLVEFAQNSRQIDPIWFRPGRVDERLEGSGLLPASVDLLKRLLYPHGTSRELFADFEPALRQLPDEHERRRFMKAVMRKETLLARLRIHAESDIESLASYWGVGGRRKDVLPLLNSLRRIEGGCKLNIVYLLPHFAREHLYSHPYTPADPAGVKQDCFWSAFNMFLEQPDDRFHDLDYTRQVIKTDYYNIIEPTQLGDLVFLATNDSVVIHAATYVADDIIFTKNGENYTQPWILMHLSDMIETYSARHPISGPVKVLYYRKKSL